jgi:hypothetical protein
MPGEMPGGWFGRYRRVANVGVMVTARARWGTDDVVNTVSATVASHMGAMHPGETIGVLVLALAPLVALGICVFVSIRKDRRAIANEEAQAVADGRGTPGTHEDAEPAPAGAGSESLSASHATSEDQ